MRPEDKYPKSGEGFARMTPKPEFCVGNPPTAQHVFTGWRQFEDGNGGEQVCKFCGLGAMSYSLQTGF